MLFAIRLLQFQDLLKKAPVYAPVVLQAVSAQEKRRKWRIFRADIERVAIAFGNTFDPYRKKVWSILRERLSSALSGTILFVTSSKAIADTCAVLGD